MELWSPALLLPGPGLSMEEESLQVRFIYHHWCIYILELLGCTTKRQDHAVTVVGYGNENGEDYWLVW